VVFQEEEDDPIISKCKHVFCREDARVYVDTVEGVKIKCPDCFQDVSIDLSQNKIQKGDLNVKSIVSKLDLRNWISSTKIEANSS
jgi:DNA repair protein RAD16